MKALQIDTKWPTQTIGEIGQVFDGPHATPKTIESGPLFLGISSIVEGKIILKKTRHVTEADFVTWTRRVTPKAGDVVFAYETRLGQVALIPENMRCCLGRRMGLVRLNQEKVDPDYFVLCYMSSPFQKFLRSRIVQGATVDRIHLKDFVHFPFPLPPLEEQKRIVAVLDAAFEGLTRAKENAEANLQDLRELANMQLDLAVVGSLCGPVEADDTLDGLLEVISEGRKNTKESKSQALPDGFVSEIGLRSGWRWLPLGELTNKISDGVHKTPRYVDQGIPFITVKNMTEGDGISFKQTKFITESDHIEFIKRTHPEKGDILISKDGTIGVVRKIETDRVFSIFVSVALVKPIDVKLSDFLTIALQAPLVQEQIVPKGAALKHLYLKDLRRLPIPIGPMSDLERTVSRLNEVRSNMRQLELALSRKLTDIADLRQSLLQKAFAGELT